MRLTRHQYSATQPRCPWTLQIGFSASCSPGGAPLSHLGKRNTDLSFLKIICSNFPSLEFSSMSWTKGEQGKNNHVSQSTEQRQLPRVLSSLAFTRGERSYRSSAKKRDTFPLYSEQGRPKRAVATAVVGASSKPQSEACFRQ